MTILDAETSLHDLSAALTRLVRTTGGVTAIYSSHPPVQTVVASVIEKIANDTIGVFLVTATQSETGLRVQATIGVADDEPAQTVCERVSTEIARYLANEGTPVSQICVKVGRVG